MIQQFSKATGISMLVAVTLLAGCATKGEVREARAAAAAAQQAADAAQQQASAAAQSAQKAQDTANQALQESRDSNAKIDNMFKKAMQK